jgi:hypothetical protein
VIAWVASLPQLYRVLVYVLLCEGIFACWAFVALYSFNHRWWHNDIGRHLVALSACLGALLSYVGLLVLCPDMPWRDAIGMGLFVSLIAVVNQRLWVFGRYDLARKRERKARAER